MMYSKMFYGRHTAQNQLIVDKNISSFESNEKNQTKESNLPYYAFLIMNPYQVLHFTS